MRVARLMFVYFKMTEIFKSTILPLLKLRRVSLVLKTENKSYLLRIGNDEYEIKCYPNTENRKLNLKEFFTKNVFSKNSI